MDRDYVIFSSTSVSFVHQMGCPNKRGAGELIILRYGYSGVVLAQVVILPDGGTLQNMYSRRMEAVWGNPCRSNVVRYVSALMAGSFRLWRWSCAALTTRPEERSSKCMTNSSGCCGFNGQRGERLARKVAQIDSDDDIGAGPDGRCQHVPVIGVRQLQAWN